MDVFIYIYIYTCVSSASCCSMSLLPCTALCVPLDVKQV